MLEYALATGFSHLVGQGFVVEQEIDFGGKILLEGLRIGGVKIGSGNGGEGYQKSGLSFDDDFGYASYGASYYGCFAGHRLEIDDAKGFVERGAGENAGVAVEHFYFFSWEHFGD